MYGFRIKGAPLAVSAQRVISQIISRVLNRFTSCEEVESLCLSHHLRWHCQESILSEYPKLINKFISVHGVCTRGLASTSRSLENVVNKDKRCLVTREIYTVLTFLADL